MESPERYQLMPNGLRLQELETKPKISRAKFEILIYCQEEKCAKSIAIDPSVPSVNLHKVTTICEQSDVEVRVLFWDTSMSTFLSRL